MTWRFKKPSLNKCPESIKGSAFNHALMPANTRPRGCREPLFPNCSYHGQNSEEKKKSVLNLCFSHLMRWEILGRPKKHFWCTGIWSLWNLAVSLWQLAQICIVCSCIVLKFCFPLLVTQMVPNTNQSYLHLSVQSVWGELNGNFHTNF